MNTKKKELWGFIVAIVTISLFALALAGTVAASPDTTYYVNATGGNDGNTGLSEAQAWQTITHAVNTVPAGASLADPNIINVSAGIYELPNETFPITFNNASISLIGAGAATTIIDGGGAAEILDINASNITIDGFTITNGTKGIFSDDFGGFTILDNTFTNVSDGVHLDINKSAADLATDYTLDAIRIRGNTFNISDKGVYLDIYPVYAPLHLTGQTLTIGDIDILDNVFDMVTMVTTYGVDIEDIWVEKVDDGSIEVGEVNISGNEFYGGAYGIDFYGDFLYLTNTNVTADNVVMNNNTFENQTETAMYIDYYDVEYWYGTTTGTYGDLEINGNTITSVTTDAIYIADYAYFDFFEDDAALTVGNLYLEDNEMNVSGDGIYVASCAEELYDNASIAMGDVFINNNTIVSRGDNGIYLEYLCADGDYDGFGAHMYNNSEVTTGAVHIDENRITASSEAIYVYYEYVAYEMEENANLSMGDIYVQNNDISGDSDGIYMYYYDGDVGYDMYDDAYAELPDYVITGNTFNVTGDGIYLYTYENPYEIYDDAIFDFGGALIDGNTFNAEDVGMDYGIYFEYYEFCYDNYDRSASIIGEVTITNNRFYDLGDDAISIYYNKVGNELEDESTLDVGDLVIADNLIENVTASDGIDVSYSSVYSYDESRLTMGMLDILRNEISNVSEDGVDIDYDLYAYDNSTLTIGRARIQRNTIDACGDAGVDLYMFLYNDTGATVNLGNPLIEGNTISNCADGITFEDVENATIRSNLLVNNTPAPSGVDLNENSVYNQIFDNCFIGNLPYQAVDNGTNNTFTSNFWDDWIGSGPYNISGTANNSDNNPRDECRLGEEAPAPAQVPALTPVGLIALVSILSVIAALTITRKRKRR
jgi:parallel beta-helix repeat protein